MNTSMFDQERIWLDGMHGGRIPQSVQSMYSLVREKLLLAGQAHAMSKESLALMSVMAAGQIIPVDPRETADDQPVEKAQAIPEREYLTPDEDLTDAQWEMAGNRFRTNGTHEYNGPRPDWINPFRSIHGDPPSVWERGRPITYVDGKSGRVVGGKFVKLHPTRDDLAVVSSPEQKRNYSIPIKAIRLTDVSRPSNVPAAVQV